MSHIFWKNAYSNNHPDQIVRMSNDLLKQMFTSYSGNMLNQVASFEDIIWMLVAESTDHQGFTAVIESNGWEISVPNYTSFLKSTGFSLMALEEDDDDLEDDGDDLIGNEDDDDDDDDAWLDELDEEWEDDDEDWEDDDLDDDEDWEDDDDEDWADDEEA